MVWFGTNNEGKGESMIFHIKQSWGKKSSLKKDSFSWKHKKVYSFLI